MILNSNGTRKNYLRQDDTTNLYERATEIEKCLPCVCGRELEIYHPWWMATSRFSIFTCSVLGMKNHFEHYSMPSFWHKGATNNVGLAI